MTSLEPTEGTRIAEALEDIAFQLEIANRIAVVNWDGPRASPQTANDVLDRIGVTRTPDTLRQP